MFVTAEFGKNFPFMLTNVLSGTISVFLAAIIIITFFGVIIIIMH